MFSKKAPEPVIEEETPVWSCDSPDCKGWMRSNFALQNEPSCPLCGSVMHEELRMLPVLVNTTKQATFS